MHPNTPEGLLRRAQKEQEEEEEEGWGKCKAYEAFVGCTLGVL